ncbi:hypothetical protein HMPREF0063_10216 [Aeromicrobium marinum DSM 15272]|uniref:Uncharacterized protein n=1 Tax=Aeromicrobium marinum DSM 15272 TaxID=585531 RepID=E2S859_9ACTN|nr:hypothetical protein [Aeromicrobium marinum]EFQ84364.1 hypothetical protein HMPREF0063_10216 [Aeromicrobium marinum DSM 15272]
MSTMSRPFHEWRTVIPESLGRWEKRRGFLAMQAATHEPLSVAPLLALEVAIFTATRSDGGGFEASCESFPTTRRTAATAEEAVVALFEELRARLDDAAALRAATLAPAERQAKSYEAAMAAWTLHAQGLCEGIDDMDWREIAPPAWIIDLQPVDA